jgi:uncharacterized ion transporter superfamily protein YfcC
VSGIGMPWMGRVRGCLLPWILCWALGGAGVVNAMPVTTGAPAAIVSDSSGPQMAVVDEGAALETVEIVLLVLMGVLGGLLGIQARQGTIKTTAEQAISSSGETWHVLDL